MKDRSMQIVIPYIKSGPELKYTLRGIEKYYKGATVYIIGEDPGFNVNYIPSPNIPGLIHKEQNIFNKISLAAHLIPEFLFMNDDHFLFEPVTENYYEGTLKEWLDRSQPNSYQQSLKNTFELIGDFPYYDIHCPMIMKDEFIQKMTEYPWHKDFGFCFKTLYAHKAKLKGVEYYDMKLREKHSTQNIKTMIKGRKFFSTGNQAVNNSMIEVLEELYPDKSSYEK